MAKAKKTRSRRSVSRNRRGYRRAGFTLPAGIILGFVPLITRGIMLVQASGVSGLQALPSSLIPYDFLAKRWTMANLGSGLYPILAGVLTHKIVGGMLGVNRALAGSRIPWLRI